MKNTTPFPNKIDTYKELNDQQFVQINALWNENYPIELQNRFPLLLTDNHILNHYIIYKDEKIIGWAVLFEINKEKRFSIIIDKLYQGKGIGNLLINQLKEEHDLIYGWVVDHNESLLSSGDNYISPLPFYIKNVFEILYERLDTEMIRAVKILFKRQIFN